LHVFDLEGNEVFTSSGNQYANDWNGVGNGGFTLSDGTYLFELVTNLGQKEKGAIRLMGKDGKSFVTDNDNSWIVFKWKIRGSFLSLLNNGSWDTHVLVEDENGNSVTTLDGNTIQVGAKQNGIYSNFIQLDQTKLRPGKYKITAGLQWSDSKGKITSVNSFIDLGEIILKAKTPKITIPSSLVISPNGDGVNDTLLIGGIDSFPNNEVIIYNRWGQEVFSRAGYTNKNGWDGRFGNDIFAISEVPDGTYFYLIEDGVGEQFTGYLSVIR
jgi:gliding motility-associated-like protein